MLKIDISDVILTSLITDHLMTSTYPLKIRVPLCGTQLACFEFTHHLKEVKADEKDADPKDPIYLASLFNGYTKRKKSNLDSWNKEGTHLLYSYPIPYHLLDVDYLEINEEKLLLDNGLRDIKTTHGKLFADKEITDLSFLTQDKFGCGATHLPFRTPRIIQKLFSAVTVLNVCNPDDKYSHEVLSYYIPPLCASLEYYLPKGAIVDAVYTGMPSSFVTVDAPSAGYYCSHGKACFFWVNYTLDSIKKTCEFSVDFDLNTKDHPGLQLTSIHFKEEKISRFMTHVNYVSPDSKGRYGEMGSKGLLFNSNGSYTHYSMYDDKMVVITPKTCHNKPDINYIFYNDQMKYV